MPKRKHDTLFGEEEVTESDVAYRQGLFQAICDVCNIDVSKLTASGRSPINKTVKEIAAVDATVAEVRIVADGIRKSYPSTRLTANFIRLRWAEFVGGQPQYKTVQPGVCRKSDNEAMYRRNYDRLCELDNGEFAEVRKACGWVYRASPCDELCYCDDLAEILDGRG